MAEPPVFLHLSQAELDRAYDQSAWAADMPGTLARYGAESARLRALRAPVTLRYAEGPLGLVDLFPAGPGAPLLFFVHGGAWRSGTRDLYAFVAARLGERGVAVAIPDFPKIAEAGLPGMMRHAAAALGRTLAEAPAHGVDTGRVVVAGHSSGAHMAACLLAGAEGAEWPRALGGALLVSGIYEMEPVLLSARSRYVSLEAPDRHRLSPLRHAGTLPRREVAVFWGSRESPEFIRQGRAFAGAAAAAGLPCQAEEIAGRDHFDLLLDLLAPESALTRAALRLCGVSGA